MIRSFTKADILAFVNLGEQFWYESNSHLHFGEYDPISVQRALDQYIASEVMVGWASFGGNQSAQMDAVLLAIKDKCLWKDINILKEVVWYARKDLRTGMTTYRLYKKAEKFAVENNFKKIVMGRIRGVPSYDKLDKFYLKNNFKSLEDEYIKDL